MWTIPDLADRFGLTEAEIRQRLEHLARRFPAHVTPDAEGRPALDAVGVTLLERVRQLEAAGMSTSSALLAMDGVVAHCPTPIAAG